MLSGAVLDQLQYWSSMCGTHLQHSKDPHIFPSPCSPKSSTVVLHIVKSKWYNVIIYYLNSFTIFYLDCNLNSICNSMLYLSFVAEFAFINDNKSMSSTNPHLFSSLKSFNCSDTAVAKSIIHTCNWWTTSSSPFLNQVDMSFPETLSKTDNSKCC